MIRKAGVTVESEDGAAGERAGAVRAAAYVAIARSMLGAVLPAFGCVRLYIRRPGSMHRGRS